MEEHFERISSAPRLSFASQDVFNLRSSQLMQLSRSAPGIYVAPTPKSILLKPKQDAGSDLPVAEEKEEEEKSYYSLRLELQFTAFVFLFFILVVVIPISMIVIGSLHLYSCPAQIMIPIFLIAGGASFLCCIGLLKKLNAEEDKVCFRKTLSFAIVFQLGWFIGGCYWIYGSYEPDYTNEGSSSYCHKTLYLYSFWLLNTIFLSLALFLVLFTVYVLFGRHHTEPTSKV